MSIKIVLFLLSFIVFKSVLSQSASKLAVETQFDFMTRSGNFQPNLKLRYFTTENHVIRGTFTTDYTNSTSQILQLNGSGVGNVQRIHSKTSVTLGYEYHKPQDKFSPYVGGELLLSAGKTDTYGLRTDSLVFISSLNYSIKRPMQEFGVHLFSGVDISIFKGLYVGTEIGIMFLNTNYKEGEFRKDDSASLTDATVIEKIPQQTIRNVLLNNMGIIRLGWRF
jgi:outer membrane protein W